MVANKKFFLLLIGVFWSVSLIAQTRQTFEFRDKPLEKCLKTTANRFGIYLSYSHRIFENSQPVSGTFSDKTLPDMLEVLLGNKFKYKIIDDYVIITERQPVPREGIKKEERIVYDTVRVTVEEVRTVYDTQTIERIIPVYDTIRIKEIVTFYDTVAVRIPKNKKRIHAGFFFGPSYRTRSSPGKDYSGLSAGGIFRYDLTKFHLKISAGYELLLNTVRHTATETVTDISTDTVSVFFVIRDGVRTPVYITEEVETQREVRTEAEKLNNLQFLSVSVTSGYHFTTGKVRAGVNVGIGADWLMRSDESLFLEDTILETRDITYRNPSINAIVQLPVGFDRQSTIFNLTPYLKYGLNGDFVLPSSSETRYETGFRIEILF